MWTGRRIVEAEEAESKTRRDERGRAPGSGVRSTASNTNASTSTQKSRAVSASAAVVNGRTNGTTVGGRPAAGRLTTVATNGNGNNSKFGAGPKKSGVAVAVAVPMRRSRRESFRPRASVLDGVDVGMRYVRTVEGIDSEDDY